MISCKNVQKSFDTVPVLKSINLDIEKGSNVAIVGSSGSGKTTLVRSMNGFVKPDDGEIFIDGEQVLMHKKRKIRQLRKSMGMIYQTFNLVGRATVLHNVLMGMLGRAESFWDATFTSLGFFKKEYKEQALENLSFVNLDKMLYKRADQLSGGEKQRVAIARTLMQRPDIILADEPIANLDPRTSLETMDLLKRVHEKHNVTLVAVLHQVEIAKSYFDRIVALKDGAIFFDGPPTELTDELVSEIYNLEKESAQ